jgi:hypothetical protein
VRQLPFLDRSPFGLTIYRVGGPLWDGRATFVAAAFEPPYFQDFRGNTLKGIELSEQARIHVVFEEFV